MAGQTRTRDSNLRLVSNSSREPLPERLLIPPSDRLSRFAAAAANRGIDLEEAIRLAVERALALADGRAFGLDAEGTRRRLRRASAKVSARRPLSASESARVRRLNRALAVPPADVSEGAAVALPERLLTRGRGVLTASAIDAGALEEMVSWEIAAALEGRTLGEWALLALGEKRAAA